MISFGWRTDDVSYDVGKTRLRQGYPIGFGVSKKEPKLPTGLSPSSFGTWNTCPRKFEEEKIRGLFSPSGPEAILGTFVHRILELLMQKLPEERTLDEAKACARIAWPEIVDHGDFKRQGFDTEAQKKFRWDAWTSVENYFAMEPPEKVDVVATERNVKCTLDGVPMRGIIDRLDREDGRLVVSDYKNGKLPNPKFPEDKLNQMNIYAAMIEAIEGERPIEGRLIFTAHSVIMPVEYTDDSVAEVQAKLKTAWEAIHANFAATDFEKPSSLSAFPAKTGMLCGWCPAVGHCPEGQSFVTLAYRKGYLPKHSPAYETLSRGGFKNSSGVPTKVVAMPRRRKR